MGADGAAGVEAGESIRSRGFRPGPLPVPQPTARAGDGWIHGPGSIRKITQGWQSCAAGNQARDAPTPAANRRCGKMVAGLRAQRRATERDGARPRRRRAKTVGHSSTRRGEGGGGKRHPEGQGPEEDRKSHHFRQEEEEGETRDERPTLFEIRFKEIFFSLGRARLGMGKNEMAGEPRTRAPFAYSLRVE